MGAFVLTILIEALLSAVLLRLGHVRLSWPQWVATILAANLTHPLLWWWASAVDPSFLHIVLAEMVIVVVEAGVWRLALRRDDQAWEAAILLSVGCNAASFLAGLLISFVA